MTRSIRRHLKHATTATLMLLVLAIAGCGSDDDDDAANGSSELIKAQKAEQKKASKIEPDFEPADVVEAFPPTIVTDGDLASQKDGSPERALLEWWRAYQFGDVAAVEELTSKATIDAIGAEQLTALVVLPGPGLQGVEVAGASEQGNSALVEAGLLTFPPAEPGGQQASEPINSKPETFEMVKQGGDWVFAQTDFLELRLPSLEQA